MKSSAWIYLFSSALLSFLAFLKTGTFTGWIILIGGPTTCPFAVYETARDIFYLNLAGNKIFNPAALVACLIAASLWMVFLILLLKFRKHKAKPFIIGLVTIWIISSLLNVFLFVIRSI